MLNSRGKCSKGGLRRVLGHDFMLQENFKYLYKLKKESCFKMLTEVLRGGEWREREGGW